MRTRLTLACVLTALAGAPAMAQSLQDWDTDGDGSLGEREFTQGVLDSGMFDAWDTNDDDAVGYFELTSGLYRASDANDDGKLSVAEWDDAADRWLGEFDVNLSVDRWDANGDGVISEAEYAKALDGTDLLARLGGQDGTLDEDGLASGLFDIADTDENDLVADQEDGFFVDVAEFFLPNEEVDPVADPETASAFKDDGMPLIERGEPFMQLPIPCGDGQNSCEQVAGQFCSALGYGEPIGSLDVKGALYVIRCQDEI